MSKSALKKHLIGLSKEQMIETVLEMYENLKPVKEYLEFFLNPNEKEMLEKYRTIIVNEFYPRGKYTDPKTRFSVAKKAIADFRTLKPTAELLASIRSFAQTLSSMTTRNRRPQWSYQIHWEGHTTASILWFMVAARLQPQQL